MRQDLNKLLCERERRRSFQKFKPKRMREKESWQKDPESAETHTTSSRIYGYLKNFNENLNPLKAQLKKATGRRWDDFYSDMCKNFKRNTTINQHIYDHLFSLIHIDCKLNEKGEVIYLLDNEWQVANDIYGIYYVHPITNIIHQTPDRSIKSIYAERRKLEEKALLAVRRIIDDNTEYHKVDGIWWFCTFKRKTYVTKKLYLTTYDTELKKSIPRLNANGEQMFTKVQEWVCGCCLLQAKIRWLESGRNKQQLIKMSRDRTSKSHSILNKESYYFDRYCDSIKQMNKKDIKKYIK
jgi:hypothetical protein